jgi:hypothetical protein
MGLAKSMTFVALLATAQPPFALAEAPSLPSHPKADSSSWQLDGTRTRLLANVAHFLGPGDNPFGPLYGDGTEGVTQPGSDSLSRYVVHVLGGIPGPELPLGEGHYFYSGDEPHNPTNESAAITRGRGGEILGLALLQRHKAVATLTLFGTTGRQMDAATRALLVEWAKAQTELVNGANSEAIQVKVETYKVNKP